MRAAGDQAKMVCNNLQLCVGLKAGIEGVTHAVGQRRLARVRERIEGTEDEAASESEEEEDGEGIASGLSYLNIETGATEEEAADGFAEALGMEVEEDVGSEGKELGWRD